MIFPVSIIQDVVNYPFEWTNRQHEIPVGGNYHDIKFLRLLHNWSICFNSFPLYFISNKFHSTKKVYSTPRLKKQRYVSVSFEKEKKILSCFKNLIKTSVYYIPLRHELLAYASFSDFFFSSYKKRIQRIVFITICVKKHSIRSIISIISNCFGISLPRSEEFRRKRFSLNFIWNVEKHINRQFLFPTSFLCISK